jgi:hypothetical protein
LQRKIHYGRNATTQQERTGESSGNLNIKKGLCIGKNFHKKNTE